MKVLTLNTWGGRVGSALLDFMNSHADIDIFCLQEMWEGGEHMVGTTLAGGRVLGGEMFKAVSDIQERLPNHATYFRPLLFDFYGMAMFVKKSVVVMEEGEVFVYKYQGYYSEEDIADHSRNAHYVRISTPAGERAIIHVHGLWNGKGKGDSPDRILQSQKLAALVQRMGCPTVLCGDFNYLPDTESVRILEASGMRNLVTEYGITSTRSSHYTKPERFADYIFVTPNIVVNDFRVLPDEVSDHLALEIDFE